MSPSVEIDEDVLALLKQNAEPFVDTPNSVLRRLLGLAEMANGHKPAAEFLSSDTTSATRVSRKRGRPRQKRSDVSRALPGTILADSEYEIPILSILDAHGGRAPTREVLEELGAKLNGSLMPADRERIGSGELRWRNRAQFVRLRLIERGDMARNSPRGVWEITDQGRDKLVAA